MTPHCKSHWRSGGQHPYLLRWLASLHGCPKGGTACKVNKNSVPLSPGITGQWKPVRWWHRVHMEFLVDGANICACKTVPKSITILLYVADAKGPCLYLELTQIESGANHQNNGNHIKETLTHLPSKRDLHHGPCMNLGPVCSRGRGEENGTSFRLKQCPYSP